jgi:hypothetical protein
LRSRPAWRDGNRIEVRIGDVEVSASGSLTSCMKLLDRMDRLLDKPGVLDAIGNRRQLL